jgi:hypothetical protein
VVEPEKQIREFFSKKRERLPFVLPHCPGFVDMAVALFSHLSQAENLSRSLRPRTTPPSGLQAHLKSEAPNLPRVLTFFVFDNKRPGSLWALILKGNEAGRLDFIIGVLMVVRRATFTVVKFDRGYFVLVGGRMLTTRSPMKVCSMSTVTLRDFNLEGEEIVAWKAHQTAPPKSL